MVDSTMSDQAKTIAKIEQFDQLFILLSKITLTQEEQNRILIGLEEINHSLEVSLFYFL